MAQELRVRLIGAEAVPGRILALDVVRLISGAERAVASAAAYQLGRQPGKTGRKGGVVELATRLRFRSIEEGSIVSVLELPAPTDDENALELDDVRLGERALRTTLDAIAGTMDEAGDVTSALHAMAEELAIGSRFDAVEFEFRLATERRTARLDASARERLARNVQELRDRRQDQRVVGLLFEADFERMTATVRTTGNELVKVQFTDTQADAIQGALRHQAQFDGRVTFDRRTSAVVSIELHRILRADQLVIPSEDFWRHRSIEELQQEQGITPVVELDELRWADAASGEEMEAFLSALGLEA